MMKAKILVQSPNIDTYINIIAAICKKYPSVTEIVFSFLNKSVNDNFINDVRIKLANLASHNSLYSKGVKVSIEAVIEDENGSNLIDGFNLIDVTAVSKEIALNVAASSVEKKNVKICQLSWTKKFEKDEKWIIEDNNHLYDDLLSKGALSKLYKNYFQKRTVIFVFAVIFGALLLTSILKIILKDFIIPSDLVNILSLLIGAAGLYLAAVSLRGSAT